MTAFDSSVLGGEREMHRTCLGRCEFLRKENPDPHLRTDVHDREDEEEICPVPALGFLGHGRDERKRRTSTWMSPNAQERLLERGVTNN